MSETNMKLENILLIEGPAVRLKLAGANLGAVRTNHPKISQLTLAAIARQAFSQSEIKVIDMKSNNQNKEAKVREMDYGGTTIEYFRVGQDFSEIEDNIQCAGTIVLTNNFTQEAGLIGDLITYCKEVNPKARVLVGGSDASVVRGEVDRQNYFYSRGADVVAPLGDGEITLLKLLRGEELSLPLSLENLENVPSPALELVDINRYTESHEGPLPLGVIPPLMYVETSRGCRQSCDFCSTPFTKGKYRYMGQQKIEDFLSHLKRNGITSLLLCEDNILSRLDLPSGRKAVLDWFDYMRQERFAWEFSNGVEVGKLSDNGNVDEELIDSLFSYSDGVGCYRSYIPLERLDEPKYRKLKSFDAQRKILSAIVQKGVPLLNLGVIIGNPQETQVSLDMNEERMKELMNLVKARSGGATLPYANVFLHIPIPGTNDYRKFHSEGRLVYNIKEYPELYGFYTSVVQGDNISCHDLTKIRRDMALRLNGEEAMMTWEHVGKYDYGCS